MNRGDVSFTFLDRVREVELNISDERWQSALALALTLPDICGGIAFPEIVKKYRDGRIMMDKQNLPARDVGAQYIRWFNEYAANEFKVSPEDEYPYICGERCWQLRCEYLHQNKGFYNAAEQEGIRFHLGVNCGTSVCKTEMENSSSSDIRIDLAQFCQRMCNAARKYYAAEHDKKVFSLYNTPVLDFVQSQRKTVENPLLVVLWDDLRVGDGLKMALQPISQQILVFQTLEECKKTLGKRKPVVWIVSDEQKEKIKGTVVSVKYPISISDVREKVFRKLR